MKNSEDTDRIWIQMKRRNFRVIRASPLIDFDLGRVGEFDEDEQVSAS